MKKLSSHLVVVLMAFSLLLAGCQTGTKSNDTNENGDKLKVVTTIAQIGEPLAAIGEDMIEVTSLMGPGVDPHLHQATTGDITKLDQSDVIFYSGLHLEANMLKAFEEMSKSKPVVAIGESIPEDQLLKDETGAIDPHIWFDIELWKTALGTAVEQIIELVPEHKAKLTENMEQYFLKLDELQQESKAKLVEIPQEQRILVTAHDAFGYFGAANDLQVVGLQGLSTEDEIGLSDINDTIALLMEHQVPAVFIESSINPDSINAVIEGAKKNGLEVKLGGELFSDAMGAAGTDEGTYIGMYTHNVKTITEGLLGKGE
ncbi:manganese transporter [Paenibacillus montaniterrae]|uniref:Manganese transporter n=1 Tax=Paenibacillus montaniterrae TaxID=429341 RepID=A0A919YQB5_9BACL|nr:manganese transporter [Paenibacillus montaniterrae]